MLHTRLPMVAVPVAMLLLHSGASSAQNYPNRPIRIVAAEAGGGTDFVARLIVPGLTAAFSQQVIVDNRGGSAVIPGEIVARATPDGHTLLLFSNNIWLMPFLEKVTLDPVRDFAPIAIVVTAPNILIVHPSLPADSVKGLIALAKARPGDLNYASGINGASSHLAAELFKAMAGVNIVRVSYKGNNPALNDLIGGQTQMMFSTPTAVFPHVKTARLKALAVTSPAPTELAPGLPTVSASGLPGYETMVIYSLFAPAATPAAIVSRLNQETNRVVRRTDVKEKFFSAGVESAGSTPEQLAATVKSDMARMGKVIRDAGIGP
jgi:tripartite-type tricarboxylate transporter receptor subunit TctC